MSNKLSATGEVSVSYSLDCNYFRVVNDLLPTEKIQIRFLVQLQRKFSLRSNSEWNNESDADKEEEEKEGKNYWIEAEN